jgi:L-ascorbate metabolism protein UlaG (beta-lactamase superfamily)
MKKISILLGIILMWKTATSVAEKDAVVTNLSNEYSLDIAFLTENGMMLTCAGKKVLIDGTININYFVNDCRAQSKPPFDSIDIILTTHEHGDHIDAEQLIKVLKSNKDCKSASLDAVCKIIIANKIFTSDLANQVINISTDFYSKVDTVINGIKFSAINIPHFDGFGQLANNGYLLNMGQFKFFYTGDALGSNYDMFKNLWTENDSIDIAFVNFEFLTNTGISIIKNQIKPRILYVTHVSQGIPPAAKVKQIKDSIPGIIIIEKSRNTLEAVRFEKKDNQIVKTEVNARPELKIKFQTQTAETNKLFELHLEKDSIVDTDKGDSISLKIDQSNGSPLPNWLSFDTNTFTLSGTPTAIGSYQIRIFVTDNYLASNGRSFELKVIDPDLVKVLENKSNENNIFYPNPAKEYLTTNTTKKLKSVFIYRENGSVVYSEDNFNSSNAIQVSGFTPGNYFLLVTDNSGKKYCQKIMIY